MYGFSQIEVAEIIGWIKRPRSKILQSIVHTRDQQDSAIQYFKIKTHEATVALKRKFPQKWTTRLTLQRRVEEFLLPHG